MAPSETPAPPLAPAGKSAAPASSSAAPTVTSVGAAGGSTVIGLLLTPLAVGIAAIALPRVDVGEDIANLVVFAGAASTAVAALAIAATSYPAPAWRLALGALAATTLVVFAWLGVASMPSAIAVDAALVAVAWAIGTSIGRRIEHPGHLLPACVVVACADAASMVSRFGPTHAIAESERALSVTAIAFPVPGTSSMAPALGVGDLVFMAIVFGAVAAHRLSLARAALLCWLGASVAGAASAVLETPVPALVPIAAAVVLGIPAARKVRPRERRVAGLAMAIAVAAACAAMVAQLVHA